MLVLGPLRERLRARSLAGDVRAGSWARGRARATQRAFLRDKWLLYSGAMVVVFGVTVGVAALMPTPFMRGLTIGGFTVAGAAALWSWTVQVTGTAPVMMGDVAEQWTAGELRKLRSRGWRLVNHFVLAKDDIDHVLIGPGGLYVVETKWSASPWQSDFGQARLRDAITQASANARSIRLWHPIRSADVPAKAVVVLWGGGVQDWAESEQIRDIGASTVVAGPALMRWARGSMPDGLSSDKIATIWNALAAQVTRRDPLEEVAHPVPPSLGELLARAGIVVGFAVVGILFLGQLTRVTSSGWVILGVGAASVLPGIAATRFARLRLAGWGWIAGVGVPIVALTIAEIVFLMGK